MADAVAAWNALPRQAPESAAGTPAPQTTEASPDSQPARLLSFNQVLSILHPLGRSRGFVVSRPWQKIKFGSAPRSHGWALVQCSGNLDAVSRDIVRCVGPTTILQMIAVPDENRISLKFACAVPGA